MIDTKIEFLIDDEIAESVDVLNISDHEELFAFEGSIDVTTEVKYAYEKKIVGAGFSQPDSKIRFGKYFQDKLDVVIIATPAEYERLYWAVLKAETPCYVVWNTHNGLQYRKMTSHLPYPDKSRCITDSVRVKIETEPYTQVYETMHDITQINRRWNLYTIADTIWN